MHDPMGDECVNVNIVLTKCNIPQTQQFRKLTTSNTSTSLHSQHTSLVLCVFLRTPMSLDFWAFPVFATVLASSALVGRHVGDGLGVCERSLGGGHGGWG